MAANSLTTNSVSSTYAQVLHIGTGSATAATIRTGDGTATALSLVTGGAKVTGTLEITGQITALGVPIYKRVTADVTATTTTEVSITDFDFTPVSGAVYAVELDIIAQSAATTTGVQIVNTGGAGSLILTCNGSAFSIAALSGTYAATSSPVASAPFGLILKGIFSPSSTANLAFAVKSEVAASAVIIKAGSFAKITRIS